MNKIKNFFLFSIIVLFVNSIISFGACLYLPAMTIIAKSLGIAAADIGKTITYYFLAFSIFSFIAGYLSDIFGRKLIIIVGIIFYLIGSFFCGIASSLILLILGRIIQAFGASMIPGTITAMIRDVGNDIQVISLLGWVSVINSIFLVGAPVVGGFITQKYGWRGNFWFLTIFAFLVLISAQFYLKETLSNKKNFNLSNIIKIYKNMIISPNYTLVLLPFIFCFAVQGSYFTAAPFIFMKKFELSPIKFGLCNFVIVAGLFIGRYFSVLLTKKFSNTQAYFYGSLIIIISACLFLFALFSKIYSFLLTLIGIGVFAAGFGCISPIAIQSSITAFKEFSGMAGALQGTFILFSSAIGSAITVALAKYFYLLNMFKIFIYIVSFFSLLILIFSLKALKYIVVDKI